MRKDLASQKGERKKFSARFDRLGKKINYKGFSEDSILLKNIIDVESQKMVADHLWFNYTKGFEVISLTPGSKIEFEARITSYTKGYVNKKLKINHRSIDYKLSHPTRIKKIS